jgi:dienelactone hydrolase
VSDKDIRSEEITYAGGGAEMRGYIAWNAGMEGRRPGILVVHEWWGPNEYARRRARMLAELGYTGMALDMYGNGRVAADREEAGALMASVVDDMAAGRARFEAALAVLRAHATVNPEQTGAIGYCFGGGVVLHMARMGADLDVVASFHGALPLGTVPGADRVRARVAAYHGEADEFFTAEQVADFRAGMERAGAHLYFVMLPGALHGFSNPQATENGRRFGLPLAYDEHADTASWAHMSLLFRDVFAT